VKSTAWLIQLGGHEPGLSRRVICGGFPSDGAIAMEKTFILMVKKLISFKPNTAIFVIPALYYCSVVGIHLESSANNCCSIFFYQSGTLTKVRMFIT